MTSDYLKYLLNRNFVFISLYTGHIYLLSLSIIELNKILINPYHRIRPSSLFFNTCLFTYSIYSTINLTEYMIKNS